MNQACHVPIHIVRHNEATAKLGVFLARRLAERGMDVDVELVERACLLHDLFRVCDFPLEDFSWFEQPISEEDMAKWRQLEVELFDPIGLDPDEVTDEYIDNYSAGADA